MRGRFRTCFIGINEAGTAVYDNFINAILYELGGIVASEEFCIVCFVFRKEKLG